MRLGTFNSGTGTDIDFSYVVHATNATLPQTVTQEQINAAINNPGASALGLMLPLMVL